MRALIPLPMLLIVPRVTESAPRATVYMELYWVVRLARKLLAADRVIATL